MNYGRHLGESESAHIKVNRTSHNVEYPVIGTMANLACQRGRIKKQKDSTRAHTRTMKFVLEIHMWRKKRRRISMPNNLNEASMSMLRLPMCVAQALHIQTNHRQRRGLH